MTSRNFHCYSVLEPLPQVRDNNWHGLCVTWQSAAGVFMVYYDGRLIHEGNNFKAGMTLLPNKAFTAGVGKEDGIMYAGRLGHINTWQRVLEHPMLAVLSSKCGVERGDWVSWPNFMIGVHGIDVVVGETCPFDGKITVSVCPFYISRESGWGEVYVPQLCWTFGKSCS